MIGRDAPAMPRMLVPLVLALLLAVAPRAGAQRSAPSLHLPAREATPVAAALRMPMARFADPAPLAERSRTQRVLLTTVSVVGGAILGSYLGYFVSQLARSDWHGDSTASRLRFRAPFAIGGAAIGAGIGYLVRPRSGKPAPPPPPLRAFVVRSPRSLIGAAELRRSIATNALEAVQELRREWLYGAGALQAPANPGEPSAALGPMRDVPVYVIDTFLGPPSSLADVMLGDIEELRYYEPGDARRRFGRELPYGAIEVIPAGGGTSR